MTELLPNIIRAIVSTTMNVLLMLSLLQPKYSRHVTALGMLGVLTADMSTSIYCYTRGNLTMLAKIDVVMFAALCLLVRPLFKDTFMQWLFSYITVQNVNMSVVILSFSISRVLPFPLYANTAVRLVLFSGMLILLNKYVRPLYRKMVQYWNVFFYVAVAIAAAFSYKIISSDNIIQTLTKDAIELNLLVLIATAAYFSICYFLKTLSREYSLKEENTQMQNDKELLHLSATSMAERLRLMDESVYQSSLAAHDRRHFNSMVLELLEQGNSEEAITFLKKQTVIAQTQRRHYCENTAVNAAVSHYAVLAEQNGISTDISLDIPYELPMDSLELAMVLSNLLENAIHGCQMLSAEQERYFRFTARKAGRLLFEISNPCDVDAELSENGYPVAHQEGHGIGTKSVIAFAAQYDADLLYNIENGVFRVRILL